MKQGHLFALGLLLALPAQAEIYKSVDAKGHVTYSNVPSKGAVKLNLEPPGAPAGRPRAAAPAGFPRVDSETQKKRDETRRSILESELAAEQKLLAEDRQALAQDEAARPAGPSGDPKARERAQKLKEQAALHEKNTEALRKELAGLK